MSGSVSNQSSNNINNQKKMNYEDEDLQEESKNLSKLNVQMSNSTYDGGFGGAVGGAPIKN